MSPWILASLLLVSHVVFAKQPKSPRHYDGYEPIIEDPEPNWETAAYSCPLSIKLKTGEYKFRDYYAYDYDTEIGTWALLKPEPNANIHHKFENHEQPYIYCHYEKIDIEIIINAKDAIACGGKGVCWTTDPYTGNKKP